MTNPYRAMCAELVDAIFTPNPYNWEDSLYESANRARALLAQPVAEGPTDEELEKLAEPFSFVGEDGWTRSVDDEAGYARAVLARWGHPTPQPVAVSERLDWRRPNALPIPITT